MASNAVPLASTSSSASASAGASSFPSSEIYGGSRSAWDYGPLGVELKENIRKQWWRAMVQTRDDIVGLDSAVILASDVWKASGHLDAFVDPLIECQSCHKRFREDHLREEFAERKKIADPDTVDMKTVACPNCGTRGAWTEPRMFNGLLRTHLGATEDEGSLHYLRPETAQGIFVNFLNVMTAARRKPPFGIAQTGKSFRNEITPGNFIFRTREFEQMEMEYFVEPGTDEEWHETWLKTRWDWYLDLGLPEDDLRLLRAPEGEAVALLEAHRRHRVPVPLRRLGVGRARGHREPHRLRPEDPLEALRRRPHLLRPGEGRALDAVRHRAGGRPDPLRARVPARCVDARTRRRTPRACMEKRTVMRLDPRLAPVKAAVLPLSRNADLSPKAKALADHAAAALERGVRRRRRDRSSLPPAGRDRYAVLHHGRLRDPRGRRGHGALAGHDGAGADRPRRRRGLPAEDPAALLMPAKFILFAQGRTGSTLLGDLLRSHADVYFGDEILSTEVTSPRLDGGAAALAACAPCGRLSREDLSAHRRPGYRGSRGVAAHHAVAMAGA